MNNRHASGVTGGRFLTVLRFFCRTPKIRNKVAATDVPTPTRGRALPFVGEGRLPDFRCEPHQCLLCAGRGLCKVPWGLKRCNLHPIQTLRLWES
ncbi:hypothetical protein DSM107133_00532 [Pseudosulfitobacter sp. DSM 107133]|nr:hypothetical protein DSM107133_00532 [Pseudosulfitobacter sp. DSM 107133]